MNSELVRPKVPDLQRDAIDVLRQISALMGRASTALSFDESGQKYAEFKGEIDEAIRSVENLELRMSVVAPMKAGKSTIINTVAGQELLPSRNAAMTTLPTEIVFKAELDESVLRLSPKILSAFQETVLGLKKKIQELEPEQVEDKLGQYPHLKGLVQKIKETPEFPNRSETHGRKEIIRTLAELNDIVRLCSILDPAQDPAGRLSEVPSIEAPLWRSQKAEQADSSSDLGNLVIVDTPGPNEAGDDLKLTYLVKQQLKRSSIVLIVLDFTQLNNKAAEDIKDQVQPVIRLLGRKNLYVLVNKVDQRRRGDMTPEQVRQFVAADLGLNEEGDSDRVFEVSAIQAFSASKFLLELQQRPGVKIVEMETAEALAQEALGNRWEARLQRKSVKDLEEEARYLWEDSGFVAFLEKAIHTLMESAAPRAIEAALNRSQGRTLELRDAVKLRSNAIVEDALNRSRGRMLELRDDVKLQSKAVAQDAEKLKREVEALEADLDSLSECSKRLGELDAIEVQLRRNLKKLFGELKKVAKVSLEDYFIREEQQQADLLKKVDIAVRTWLLKDIGTADFRLFSDFIPEQIKSSLEFKHSGEFEFESEAEAREFADQSVLYAKQRAEIMLVNFREKTGEEIEKSQKELSNFLKKETEPIIERARTRLKEAFDVDLSLPAPSLEAGVVDSVELTVARKTRHIDGGFYRETRKKRVWWNWLFTIEVEAEIRRPDRRENYYIVSLQELIEDINYSIELRVADMEKTINKYLEEDFQDKLDDFFNGLNSYLRNYQNSLIQAQKDRVLDLKRKENLVAELKSLVLEAEAPIEKTSVLLQRTENWMVAKG